MENCHHSEKERAFIVECLADDVIFVKSFLNYKVKVLSIVYFKEKMHYEKLSNVARNLYNYRLNSNCDAVKFITKDMILRGFGRFALDISKDGLKNSQIFSRLELETLLCNKSISSFDVFENLCFVAKKKKTLCI